MMKPYGMSLCALASLVALSLPCLGQDSSQSNPWNGSWKMDPSSLKYDGPTASIATDADGYTITRDGKPRPKVVCDGKPNAPVDGAVSTCTKVGTGYDVITSRDGKQVNEVKVEVSPDGKTMTRTAQVTPPDGSTPFSVKTILTKVSGDGTGAAGTWKETSFTESQDTGVLAIQVNGDSIDFKETDNDKPIALKLDGTPVSFAGGTISIKQDGPRTLKVTYSRDGKVGRENTFVLSDDGQSITETDVTPAPMASTMTVTHRKS